VHGVTGAVIVPHMVSQARHRATCGVMGAVVGLCGCVVTVAMPHVVSQLLVTPREVVVIVIAVSICAVVGPRGGGWPHIHWQGWQ